MIAESKRNSLELSTDYVAPSGDVEAKVAEIWADILRVDSVGCEDDFFELGGDSLAAESLVTSLESAFGFHFKQSQVLEVNTPRKLAGLIAEAMGEGGDQSPPPIPCVNENGTKPAIFWIHGDVGFTFLRPRFMEAIDPDQPIFLFQAPGYDGLGEPLASVGALAAAYVRLMLAARPDGPWNLVSMCGGGWIALEMIHLMAEQGLRPSHAILLDPIVQKPIKDEYRRIRFRRNNIPFVADALNGVANTTIDLVDRTRVFVSTGVFKSERNPDAINDDRVRAYMIRRFRNRHGVRQDLRKLARKLRTGETRLSPFTPEVVKRIAPTRAMLKHAFRTYRPRPTDYPVVMAASQELSTKLADREFPLNGILPNRKVVVSGERHREAVSSPFTAHLVQQVVDGVDVEDIARQSRADNVKREAVASDATRPRQ